jgi:hypothetical protein
MATLAEVLTKKTTTELLPEVLADLDAEGASVEGFSPYSVNRAMPTLAARAMAYEQGLRVDIVEAGFLDDVDEKDPDWIDRHVLGFFRVARLRATKAVHSFRLLNTTTGGPYTIAPRALEASTNDGIKFRNINTTQLTLAAGNTATLNLDFEAVEVGITGNISPGDITKLTTPIPGVDIVNLPGTLIKAALDTETNRQYVERALARWGTLAAGGHATALRYNVQQAAPTITRVGIRDDNPFGPGSVGVYLANASGPATTDEIADLIAPLTPIEPLGSGEYRYLAANENNVIIQAVLDLDGTNVAAATNAAQALQKLAAQWPMATGTLDIALIYGVLRGGAYKKYGLTGFGGVESVQLVSPTGPTSLAAQEVLTIATSITTA